MNFREATDAILSPRSIGTIARALGVSEASVKAARKPEGAEGYRKPPRGWEEALAAFTEAEAEKMRRVSEYLRKAEEAYHEQGTRTDAVAPRKGGHLGRDVGLRTPAEHEQASQEQGAEDETAPGLSPLSQDHGMGTNGRSDRDVTGGAVNREAKAPSTGESAEGRATDLISYVDGLGARIPGADLYTQPARVPVTKELQTRRRKK